MVNGSISYFINDVSLLVIGSISSRMTESLGHRFYFIKDDSILVIGSLTVSYFIKDDSLLVCHCFYFIKADSILVIGSISSRMTVSRSLVLFHQ